MVTWMGGGVGVVWCGRGTWLTTFEPDIPTHTGVMGRLLLLGSVSPLLALVGFEDALSSFPLEG